MASSPESTSMALFCDFENVALGVRDAHHDKFDIKRVLERLLLKGSIVVKKAYCDWDRYKQFKATMHEANFELIEIPHVRQSGKNSADIRLVVDALDLCYTKSHVDTFVIISGDSDFSPLVSKLRENAKQVIGVGVKQSTSDLLIANCDEFIFYDDLVREGQRSGRSANEGGAAPRRPAEGGGDGRRSKEDPEARRTKAIDLALETLEALGSERADGGKIRASVLKDAIKRRRPDFNETYFGFRSFGSLLEEAQARGLLEVVRDEKTNAYVQRVSQAAAQPRGEPRSHDQRSHEHRSHEPRLPTPAAASPAPSPVLTPVALPPHAPAMAVDASVQEAAHGLRGEPPEDDAGAETDGLSDPGHSAAPRHKPRTGRTRKPGKAPASAAPEHDMPDPAPAPALAPAPEQAPEASGGATEAPPPARKRSSRTPRKSTGSNRRPRKPAAGSE